MASRLLRRTLWNLLKLGGCAASILVVGWAVLVFDGGEVDEASADILSLSPVPLSNTARFENSLDALGHGEPRVYDFNGNEVAFSTRYTDDNPARVVADYQRTFVEHGLNEQAYGTRPGAEGGDDEAGGASHRQRAAMLSGQPVPLTLGENYASMGAALVADSPETRRQLERVVASPPTEEVDEFFQGFRLVEVFRDPSTGSTSVTASWSRGEFEASRHMPSEPSPGRAGRAEGEIPVCEGCLRMVDFSGEANATSNTVKLFGTDRDKRQVTRFYDRQMAQQGWQQARESQIFNRVVPFADGYDVEATVRRYKRGDESVALGIRRHPSLDKTLVTTYQSQ